MSNTFDAFDDLRDTMIGREFFRAHNHSHLVMKKEGKRRKKEEGSKSVMKGYC